MSQVKERELLFSVTLKDCKVETFRAGGKGGQHQNKTDSAVRITHSASGAVGESREHRSQFQNKQAAFKRMATSEAFKKWHKIEVSRRMGREAEIEAEVKRQMAPANIKTEVHDERGRWVKTDAHD